MCPRVTCSQLARIAVAPIGEHAVGGFVRDACTTRTDRLVIRSVVAIARGLGKQSVAEHVGDEPSVALLREFGVEFGPGYFSACRSAGAVSVRA